MQADDQAVVDYLTALWAKVLGRPVAADVNFFDAGGSSLTGVNMLLEVQTRFGVELDLETFYDDPCIATLAESIARSGAAARASA